MNYNKQWRREVKRFMHRFRLETAAQAEEVMAGPTELWRGLMRLDVPGRRYVAAWLVERRKEKNAQLTADFSKHFAEQGRRQQNLIERAIWWIATKPWVRSATGYTRAYHVANDVEVFDAFLRWFNDASDVIDQHYSNFGMRLAWGFVQRDGEEVKAIELSGASGVGRALLDWLATTDQTLTRKPPLPLSDEERALRAAARDKINQAVARWKEGAKPGTIVPFLVPGDRRLNYRPDAPPQSVESYGPEDWKLMSDFLFIVGIPEKALEHQAKAYDGWWNRKGRKKVAFQNIRSRIAPFS